MNENHHRFKWCTQAHFQTWMSKLQAYQHNDYYLPKRKSKYLKMSLKRIHSVIILKTKSKQNWITSNRIESNQITKWNNSSKEGKKVRWVWGNCEKSPKQTMLAWRWREREIIAFIALTGKMYKWVRTHTYKKNADFEIYW